MTELEGLILRGQGDGPTSLLPKSHRIEDCTHGSDPDQSSRLGRRCYLQYASELWPTFQEATVRKAFLAGIAVAGLLSGPALASDLPAKAPVYKAPIAVPPYNWSGLYVGANFGGGWSNGSLNIPGNNLYGGLSEFIGGVQAGYNFQAGHFLFGVEGDFDGASFSSSGPSYSDIRLCGPALDRHRGGPRRPRQ